MINRDVWILDKEKSWVAGIVINCDDTNGTITVQDIETKEIKLLNQLQVLDRDYKTGDIDDLINLSHLHEASILHSLKFRYSNDIIYTNNGPILIAINPFKKLNCYDDLNSTQTSPHVYAVAQKALDNLKKFNKNQTILASGESGSGKTMTTKFILNYFANAKSTIQDLVIMSNPLLEAFGNAKTIMNDNSSRFGKFIKLDFNNNYEMSGGTITTYLLEKIRIIKQNKNERNFHIIYQMFHGSTTEEKKRWMLLNDLSKYKLISNPNILTRNDNIDDAEEWIQTLNSMESLDFSFEEKERIFTFLSGILMLGNAEINNDKLIYDDNFINSCKLLNISPDTLNKYLTIKTLKINNHKPITINLNNQQILESINTFIQESYDRLFNWLVNKINKKINNESTNYFIGVIDIFGFEIFDKNSLEQLQINYTNEYLQQQFNNYIFKLEQQEYVNENIPWNSIDFPDNEIKLKAIHDDSNSIFSILNDQCLAPQGSDQKVLSNYQYYFSNNELFCFDPKTIPDGVFSFNHYAGWVSYNVDNFCHKNKLYYHDEIQELIKCLGEMFQIQIGSTSLIKTTMKTTTCTLFKHQLKNLINTISNTTPQYVRCLKPNDLNQPSNFNSSRILQQLKYSGVLEAVKVSRAGFPIRFLHKEFAQRYKFIDSNQVDIKYGKTKYFMKQLSYDQLEDMRLELMIKKAICIQSNVRMFIINKKYKSTKINIIKIQNIIKIYQARKILINLRQKKAIKIIINVIKIYINRQKYRKFKSSIIQIQRQFRCKLIINRQINLVYTNKIITLQKYIRRLLQQKKYNKIKRAVIIISTFWHKILYKRTCEKNKNIIYLNHRISIMEQQLKELINFRTALIAKENELKIKDQVSYELCEKMNQLMVEHHEMKYELQIYKALKLLPKPKSRFWLFNLFG
jgi:myosin-5